MILDRSQDYDKEHESKGWKFYYLLHWYLLFYSTHYIILLSIIINKQHYANKIKNNFLLILAILMYFLIILCVTQLIIIYALGKFVLFYFANLSIFPIYYHSTIKFINIYLNNRSLLIVTPINWFGSFYIDIFIYISTYYITLIMNMKVVIFLLQLILVSLAVHTGHALRKYEVHGGLTDNLQ